MPFFGFPRGERGGLGSDLSPLQEEGYYENPSRVRSVQPVRIAYSTPVMRQPYTSPTSATSLLGHAAMCPSTPSYETIQHGVPPCSPHSLADSQMKPPSYNPQWERLPRYGDATTGMVAPAVVGGSPIVNLGATPPSYWARQGHAGTMVPIATGGGGMFFNSPFQQYQMMHNQDLEQGRERGDDRICGMATHRVDIVINLSLLAICILIWSAVELSLSFSDSRDGGQGNSRPETYGFSLYGGNLFE